MYASRQSGQIFFPGIWKSTVNFTPTTKLFTALAKPLVDMIEKIYGINPPSNVRKMIRRIKRAFHRKLYGKAIKAKTVVMKTAHFRAMNHITRNKHVNVGEDYERE